MENSRLVRRLAYACIAFETGENTIMDPYASILSAVVDSQGRTIEQKSAIMER